MSTATRTLRIVGCLLLGPMLLGSCALLNGIPKVEIKPPQVSFTGDKLIKLSFD